MGYVTAFIIINANPRWKFKLSGLKNLPPKTKGVVYVANHRSMADILALFYLNIRFRWLSKASVFKVPIMGWCMSAVGHIKVHRHDKDSRQQCMKEAANLLKKDIPMVLFPEGTRTKDNSILIGAFKKGAFTLAKSAGVPVVPISIVGCDKLLPSGKFIPSDAKVFVHVHKAIESDNLTVEELMEKSKQAIVSFLETHQNDALTPAPTASSSHK